MLDIYTETRSVKVYILRCSPTLRGIVVSVFTKSASIKLKKSNFFKLKTSLGRNFVNNLQTFRGFVEFILRFCCKFSMNIIFYLTSEHREAKFLAFLVFVCTTASFIAQISPCRNVYKQHAILAPVAKQ